MPKERPEAKVIPKTPFIPFKLFSVKATKANGINTTKRNNCSTT